MDLAIAAERPLPYEQKALLLNELSLKIRREVDLVDLRTATGVVLTEAMTKWKVLKHNPPVQAAILKRMWLDREDFERERERLQSQRRKVTFGA